MSSLDSLRDIPGLTNGIYLADASSQKRWQMKVYRDPLLKNTTWWPLLLGGGGACLFFLAEKEGGKTRQSFRLQNIRAIFGLG